jgi:hyperosmotically inducible protein
MESSTTRRLAAASIGAALVLALAACGEDKPPPKPAAKAAPAPRAQPMAPKAEAMPAPAAAPAPAEVPAPKPDADQALAAAVKAALEANKGIDAQGIDVTAKGGAVTLWGTVAQAERRALAVKIARSVPGVKSVQSNLQVVRGS